MTNTALNPSVFSFNSNPVNTFSDDHGEPWFLANDVCAILGYRNPSKTINDHCKPKGITKRYTPTSGGNQEMTFINEGNLFRLIIKSRKPEAEAFETLVMDEILPAIRKTGKYETSQPKPKKRYDFPLETADPHDRDLANALITAKTILDERNNAPELDLLNRLEQDGYDVSGAKIRIYAMYRVAKQLIDMQNELSNVHQRLQFVDNTIKELTVQRGENVVFQGRDAGAVIGRRVTRSLSRR